MKTMAVVYSLGKWYAFEKYQIENDGGITPIGPTFDVTESMESILKAQKAQWMREMAHAG